MKRFLILLVAIVFSFAMTSSVTNSTDLAPPAAYVFTTWGQVYDCDYVTAYPNNCENGHPTNPFVNPPGNRHDWSQGYSGDIETCWEYLCKRTDPTTDGQKLGYLCCRVQFSWKIMYGSSTLYSGTWHRGDAKICGPPTTP